MYLAYEIENDNGHDDDKQNLIIPNIDVMIGIEFDKYIAYKVDKSERATVYAEHVRVAQSKNEEPMFDTEFPLWLWWQMI